MRGQQCRSSSNENAGYISPGEDGVGGGDGQDADDQHDVVGPGHGGVAPAETHLGALSYGTPGVEYTGLQTGKDRVDSQDVPPPGIAAVHQGILRLHLTRSVQKYKYSKDTQLKGVLSK